MITLLIGHRGTGKTRLLQRIQNYFSNDSSVLIEDLDEFIQHKAGATIAEIFSKQGEYAFRQLEQKSFQDLLLKAKNYKRAFVSLGAGFEVSKIPPEIHCVWVRRLSDDYGRIFTDRPRLEASMTPLEEFHHRAAKRSPQYKSAAWEEYYVPEGLDQEDESEKKFFKEEEISLGGVLTLLPHWLRNENQIQRMIQKRLKWSLDFFELRTDLLSPDQIASLTKLIPKEKILFSLRENFVSFDFSKFSTTDWALELGAPPAGFAPTIVSLHERDEGASVETCFAKLAEYEKRGIKSKLAIEVNSWEELAQGHQWVSENLKQRSFLPRSSDGRWSWYRLYMKGKMFLNFFREGEGSAIDQPLVHTWWRAIDNCRNFAAILGSPVAHSFTPIEQKDFFQNRKMPVFAVEVKEGEFFEAMDFLEQLGLKAAAVTSPLKLLAYEFCDELTQSALEFKSVNTLVFEKDHKQWVGENTDYAGLEALIKAEHLQDIAVWGGGGVLPLLEVLLKSAHFFSARSGENRKKGEDGFVPRAVVWAAPRSPLLKMPLATWRPDVVIDLNYREDSMGREYALMTGAKYISGVKMFYIQAQGQRRFWKDHL